MHMVHDMLVATIFAAMVLTPCVVAMFSRVEDTDSAVDWNVADDGFI
jgi:hypothetical protein